MFAEQLRFLEHELIGERKSKNITSRKKAKYREGKKEDQTF